MDNNVSRKNALHDQVDALSKTVCGCRPNVSMVTNGRCTIGIFTKKKNYDVTMFVCFFQEKLKKFGVKMLEVKSSVWFIHCN